MLSTLLPFQDLLRTSIAGRVEIVPVPVSKLAKSLVNIWVWRVEEDSVTRLPRPEPMGPPIQPAAKLHCGVFASDLALLEQVRQLAFQTPILTTDTGRIRVLEATLSPETILSLFIAAKIAPRACLFYVLQAEASQETPSK